MMNIRCIRCKGSDPANNCGRTFCPIIANSVARFRVEERTGKDVYCHERRCVSKGDDKCVFVIDTEVL